MYQITYMSRRRAGMMRTVPTITEAIALLRKLWKQRTAATVRNATREEVGAVYKNYDGRWTWYIDTAG